MSEINAEKDLIEAIRLLNNCQVSILPVKGTFMLMMSLCIHLYVLLFQ